MSDTTLCVATPFTLIPLGLRNKMLGFTTMSEHAINVAHATKCGEKYKYLVFHIIIKLLPSFFVPLYKRMRVSKFQHKKRKICNSRFGSKNAPEIFPILLTETQNSGKC